MTTLVYLIANRKKYSSTKPFLKAWIKRMWHFPALLRLGFIRYSLSAKGAKIGLLSDCVETVFTGKLSHLRIGDSAFVGRCKIVLHDCLEIGNSVVINDDVTILTASHLINDSQFRQISKPVIIGDYAWVCTGATILPGVRIGRGAVVAACAVVSKDVPPFAVVAGNPAVCVKYREKNLSYRPNLLRACYEAWVGTGCDEIG